MTRCTSSIKVYIIKFMISTVIYFFSISTSISSENSIDCSINDFADTLGCSVDTLSWVEARFQGDVLKSKKDKFEQLIRLRARNDISILKHETLKFSDAFKKYNTKLSGLDLKRRSQIFCNIWTVGENYPIAIHIECTMSGYGVYKFTDRFSHSTLGYGAKERIESIADESIRNIIAKIAQDFLEDKESSVNALKKD